MTSDFVEKAGLKTSGLENLGQGIYCVDARYIRQGIACCYLMVEAGQVAIIETGTAHTAEGIAEALAELELPKDAVRYIIPTHVHLDHAGGAGLLMQQYPEAKMLIHPRGARHMVNPLQLIASSKSVYGEEKFAQLYGDLIPVDKERVIRVEDGEKHELNGRTLEFRHTPGHAEHHFCLWDSTSEGWFSGDTFGISYYEMGHDLKNHRSDRFIIPTTSPVQFDPDKLLASIDLMMSYNPKKFYLTHYSVMENPEPLANLLRTQIEDYRQIAQLLQNESEREKRISQALKDITLARLSSEQPKLDLDTMEKVLAMDLDLNAQGLDIWLKKQESVK